MTPLCTPSIYPLLGTVVLLCTLVFKHPLCVYTPFVPLCTLSLCVHRYRVKVIVELREYFLRKQREEEERVKQAKLAEIKRMYDAAFSIQRMARAHMVRFDRNDFIM